MTSRFLFIPFSVVILLLILSQNDLTDSYSS